MYEKVPNVRSRMIYANISRRIKSADVCLQKKTKLHIDEFIFVVISIAISTLLFVRCQYGIEITDEAYYYADALIALKGNIPYVYNTSNVAGMALFIVPFIAFYQYLVPSLAGLFLYMRLCYVFFLLATVAVVYFVLRKRFPRRVLLPTIIILLVWFYLIPAFSYNTIPFWTNLAAAVIISEFCLEENKKKRIIGLLIAGVMSTFAVFCHPLYVVATFTHCVLLVIFSKNRRIRNLINYLVGMFLQVAVFLIPICIQVGLRRLVNGINIMLFQRQDLGYINKSNRFHDFLMWLYPIFNQLFLIAIFAMALLFAIKLLFCLKYGAREAWQIAISVSAVYSVCHMGRSGDDLCASFAAIGLGLSLMELPIIRDRLMAFVALPAIAFWICETHLPPTGSGKGRAVYLYTILFAAILCLINSKQKVIHMCLAVCIVLIAFFMLDAEQFGGELYRDGVANSLGTASGKVSDLTCRVSDGIYKGILSVEENAENIIELENYIRTNTNELVRVSFRDNIPFAYLASNGLPCDIRTWDAMQYHYQNKYNTNNPINMYKYYKNTNKIPDKYIYIDFGRDEQLSCDDDTWRFNIWLDNYYKCVSEQEINEQFSAKIYEYNGNFDGDYDYWIDTCTSY